MDDDIPPPHDHESGVTLLEYALLLLLVLLIAAPAVTSFGTALKQRFRDIAGGGSFTTMGNGGFEVGDLDGAPGRRGR